MDQISQDELKELLEDIKASFKRCEASVQEEDANDKFWRTRAELIWKFSRY
jgi:archaellum biogenesis protein FlaJ (TadC family)